MPRLRSKTKYIFVSGGVVSGLGKGITAASLGMLLSASGVATTIVKVDMYLNLDAGTIRPQEHGEVFVMDDGMECDQDIGHYERFLDISLKRENYMTTGQVYKAVIDRERAFGYQGEDVEAIPHVTDEIIDRIVGAGRLNNAEIVIVELGGTVGEYQNGLFFEANRILKLRFPKQVFHIHVSYLPLISSLGELKSKPAQQSVHLLNAMGIQPDLLVVRSSKPLDSKRRDRLALFCNVRDDEIISNPDLDTIYKVPLHFHEQGLVEKISKKIGIRFQKPKLKNWINFVEGLDKGKKEIKIAIVGKYYSTGDYTLSDSYICVVEALKHACSKLNAKLSLIWFNSDSEDDLEVGLRRFDGIVVPQGWGSRGVEGKIAAVRIARDEKIPYLGLCFGMQMAVIEYGRNKAGLKDANSVEVSPKTNHPIVNVMPDQEAYLRKHQYGGTIRLGSWECSLVKGTVLERLYQVYGSGPNVISGGSIFERHRHRYEVNNDYLELLTKSGLVISGTSPDGKLVEAIELPKSLHPFFIGTQFHPEYKSRPLSPHPVFVGFVQAAILKSKAKH